MAGGSAREVREAQAKVLRVVLVAGEGGLSQADLEALCEGLGPAEIEASAAALIASGLLQRTEARLHPSAAAARFDGLRPL